MVGSETAIVNLSECLDQGVPREMRQKIECRLRGSAVYDSIQKMCVIPGNERIFGIPAGSAKDFMPFPGFHNLQGFRRF